MAAPVVVQGKVVGPAPGPADRVPQPYAGYAPGAPAPYAFGATSGPTLPQPKVQRPQLEVLQLSCRDQALPPEIRLNFIKKVYGILGAMMVITFGISTPFIFKTDATLSFFSRNVWILYIAAGIVIAQVIFDLAMSCQMCCGGTGLLESYLWMMRTPPWNYLYLMTFSACFGIFVGFLCAQYTVKSVLLVFALTFVLIVALTIYAVRTKADFTGCGAYILVLFLGLIMLIMVYSFVRGPVMSKVVAGAGAMLFGFLIVYDTQQIFGSASASFGGGKRDLEYTVDMYALAAWNLYLDFLNFFIYLLQLFGERR